MAWRYTIESLIESPASGEEVTLNVLFSEQDGREFRKAYNLRSDTATNVPAFLAEQVINLDNFKVSMDALRNSLASALPTANLDLLAYAASKRYLKEVGGLSFNGIVIATDDRSKLMIMGARMRAMSNPDNIEQWAAGDGNVYPLNAATVVMISDAVAAHVSNCFVIYDVVKADIVSGAITTQAQVDAAFSGE